jgi:16S rRNA (guanine(527)-N(7))-methyltransferase RsmG
LPESALASGRALTAKPERLLVAELARLGIASTGAQRDKLLAYAGLVIAENTCTNLTGAVDTQEFIVDHIVDSLRVLPAVKLASPIIDIGSGAGLPGIPLSIMLPDKNFVLVEPRAKRAAFLESTKQALELRNAVVVRSSALGPGARGWLGKARWAVMRAVALPERTFALGAPLLKPGGSLLLFAGRAQLTAAIGKAAVRAGLSGPSVLAPGELGRGSLWVLGKLH